MRGWEEEISKLLGKITSKKESEFFRDPVDWEAMGLTDYPTIIKQPMDLRTVREKLERREFSSPLEAANDVRLIFLNAMTYNAPGSRVYVYAKTLSDLWETSCASLLNREDDLDRPATIEEMTHWVDKCHRPDSNEVEVNVDLLTGRSFREAAAATNSILPDIVLASSNRRSLVKGSSQASTSRSSEEQQHLQQSRLEQEH